MLYNMILCHSVILYDIVLFVLQRGMSAPPLVCDSAQLYFRLAVPLQLQALGAGSVCWTLNMLIVHCSVASPADDGYCIMLLLGVPSDTFEQGASYVLSEIINMSSIRCCTRALAIVRLQSTEHRASCDVKGYFGVCALHAYVCIYI